MEKFFEGLYSVGKVFVILIFAPIAIIVAWMTYREDRVSLWSRKAETAYEWTTALIAAILQTFWFAGIIYLLGVVGVLCVKPMCIV